MEHIREGLKDKSPNLKEETIKFMHNFLKKKDSKASTLFRPLTEKLIQLTEDGNAKVRSLAFDMLVAIKHVHGMKFFADKLRLLDPKKLQTLELARSPVDAEPMEVEEEATVAMAVVPVAPLIKESNTNTSRLKPSKSMEVEPSKSLQSSRVAKNDDGSSINSNGEYKVPRTLNLNYLEDISAPNEIIRTTAYQQMANKYLARDIKQFLRQIKQNALRESSPTILKHILGIAKKYVNGGEGDLEIA
jgi:hypothetical protein